MAPRGARDARGRDHPLRARSLALRGRPVRRASCALLVLPLRLALATVFWNSAMAHLANWDTTLELFDTEYRLPFLPPGPAAYMAVAIELAAPVLLAVGLLTRPTALVLLGMTTV